MHNWNFQFILFAVADKADLAFALPREEDAIARERAAVEERKRETLEFKKKLDEQTAIQAEDKGWMDKYYKEEADKAWEKREITWRAEAEARRRLMAEVAVTRVLQMEDKKAQAAMEGERDAVQLDIWRREQEAAEARERDRLEARRRMGETHAEQTRQQLSDRARQRALEKQAEFLEWKMQEKTEKEYAARVQALLRVRSFLQIHFSR
jgi:colicin import membrane protein